MTKEQAIQYLNASFLFGSWYRLAAIKTLAYTKGVEPILILAKALLANHPNSTIIAEILKRLSPTQDEKRIVALWQLWVTDPKPTLATVLINLGWPRNYKLESGLAKQILRLVTYQCDSIIVQAAICCTEVLPDDESVNEALYIAWINSQSKDLEEFIAVTKRQPENPALEILHALVNGEISHYIDLDDPEGELLAQAVKLATRVFVQIMAETIANSINNADSYDDTASKLRILFRKALYHASIDYKTCLTCLKIIGDEEGLFEQIPRLKLDQVLELCERWINNITWADSSHKKLVLQQAIIAYQNLQNPQKTDVPTLPDGMVDIFTYWKDGHGIPNMHYLDNPLARARIMYLDYIQQSNISNTPNVRRLADQHWLERLMVYFNDTQKLQNAQDDHIYWIANCAQDADYLQTPMSGTPDVYLRHKNLLDTLNRRDSPTLHANNSSLNSSSIRYSSRYSTRTSNLIKILCAFQSIFIGTEITVETLREPMESNAIELEDYEPTNL
ncbi:hypothetical protein TI05_07195 [Achromatium sp. WMS3]|nr:hypothetical protein TI05_07195 [Achromatium sp. WMS3]